MSKKIDTQPPVSPRGKKLVVLVLDRPPSYVMDWYWKKIAGVPFLLRNILNIQLSGVDRLILFLKQHQDIDEKLYRHVASDPRLKLPLQWVARPEQLIKEVNDGSDVLILGCSSLHCKTKIISAIKLSFPLKRKDCGFSVLIDKKTMSNILGKFDDFNPSWFKQVLKESASVSDGTFNGQMLTYLPDVDDQKISLQEDFALQNERLLRVGGGLSSDSFLTRLFSRSVSKLMTRFFIGTPFSPNQITLLSFSLGLASAWCFYHLDYWMGVAGGFLFLLAIWVDGVDGEIARLKLMETELGGKLDILCDNVVHLFLFFSIGMGLYVIKGQSIYLYLGGLAAFGSLISFMLMGTSVIKRKLTVLSSEIKEKVETLADKFANRDFTYFLLLMALAEKLELFIWIAAVGSNLFAFYLIYCKLRSLKK